MLSLAGLMLREKTRARVRSTVTFNAPGTYVPEYGKTKFVVGGKGAKGNTNPTTGGNTNPSDVEEQVLHEYVRKTDGGIDSNLSNWFNIPGNTVPEDYGTQEDISSSSNVYNYVFINYYFRQNGANTNPISGGNSNTGAPANVLGVPFPGGVGGPAPTVGDTAVSLPYTSLGYSITVPSGGYVTIKNLDP